MSTETDAGGAVNGLADKALYSELTEKQQAVVDAIVDNPDVSVDEQARIADCSVGYVYNIRDSYPDIIEEREHVVNNHHDTVERGNVRVEGEIDVSDVGGFQGIHERPVKSTENGNTVEGELEETVIDTNAPRIDDFLPAATCDRLEAIADDISPVWLDRRATVEETIQALAAEYDLEE